VIAERPRRGQRLPRPPLAPLLAAALAALPCPALAVDVDVEVEGIRGELRDNVRNLLAIAHADDPSADRVRELHASAPGEIQEALQPFGYYRPTVEGSLEQRGEDFTARYQVDPGPLMRLAGVDLLVTGSGAARRGFQDALRDFPLRRGSAVEHAAYEAGKEALANEAAASGYLDADFLVHEIRVDLAAYTARVRLHFHTGPQYRFGEVTFDEAMLDEDLLRGFVPFETGDPFDLRKLLELQNALSGSPYFRRVEVAPQEAEAVDLHVPVHVLLVPARRQRWQLGLGYGPETGVRTTLGFDLRRVNRRGHRAETDLKLSEIESRVEASFIVPKREARTDFATYSVGYAELDSATERHRTAVVAAGLDRARGDWRERFELRWQQEDFRVGPDSGVSELLMPVATWRRVEADDVLYPLAGHELRGQVRGTLAQHALSNASFLQLNGQAEYVRALWGPVRGLGRLTLGYTESDDFRDLPPSIRYFAGGDQSVRGYGYQELTPRTPEGLPLGGSTLLTASFELDALFLELEKWGRWGLAVFYDAGNAMDAFDLGDLSAGAGAGIRWLSPVGLVRADAAMALDLPGQPIRFHFSLGPDL
jgi:translocation and assembly module TamA